MLEGAVMPAFLRCCWRITSRSASRWRVMWVRMAASAPFAVACLQGGEHGQVLRQALLEPARRVQLLQPRELQDLAQVADHLRQPAVAGQLDDRLVDAKLVA
jgi:hypothetical protein